MRIIARSTLRRFWEQPAHRSSEQPLRAWFHEVWKADWAAPADAKSQFRGASFTANNRIVFNVGGNRYRLVVRVNYPYRVVYVRFIGTHSQYDQIDASKV